MKKLALTGVLLLYRSVCHAQSTSLQNVRLLYQKAALDKKACKKLIRLLKPYNETNDPLLLGYKTSATMMMAQYVLNPFRKLTYFNSGKNMLEKAIEADSEIAELRLLRYAAQKNAPSFLGYDEHIDADKLFLNQSIEQSVDTTLKKLIQTQLE